MKKELKDLEMEKFRVDDEEDIAKKELKKVEKELNQLKKKLMSQSSQITKSPMADDNRPNSSGSKAKLELSTPGLSKKNEASAQELALEK